MIKCKRIIDGKTYNTETATFIYDVEYEDGCSMGGQSLYQTRFGAFFLVSDSATFEDDTNLSIAPISATEAQDWLEKYASAKPELIERLFGEMPEGGSSEVKFTLRLPESLRDRLAHHASANKQSLNAWIIRCLESCAAAQESQ
jgi:predicted HicB family RNase H-like nuclease